MYTLAIVKYFCLNTIDLPQKKINDDIYLIRDYRHRGNLASFFARVYNRADKLSMTFCGKKMQRNERAGNFSIKSRHKRDDACGDVVGMTGFEPAASSSRTKRATKLRYIPSFM